MHQPPLRVRFLVVLSVAAAPWQPLSAQAPTLTVHGSLSANASGVVQQFGPGTLSSSGQSLAPIAPNATASVSVGPGLVPPPGTTGLRCSTAGTAQIGSFTQPAGTFSNSTDVLVTIAPVSMGVAVLVVRWQATASGGTAQFSIDVGNDNAIEFSGAVSLFAPSADVTRELGVPVAAGAPVRVRQSAQGSALTGFAQVQARLDLTVFPGASPITNGAGGCLPLTWSRPAAGTFVLRCMPPAGGPTAFLFGFAPQNGTLPWAPSCPLLLQLATSVPAVAVGGAATLTLPDLVLPPGFAVHTQAMVVLGPNDVRSSGALLMTGF